MLKPANLCEGCKVLHSSWPCCLDGLDIYRYNVGFTGRRLFFTEDGVLVVPLYSGWSIEM
jgi:hypothetical protein